MHLSNVRFGRSLLLLLGISLSASLLPQPLSAQTPLVPQPSTAPLELSLLEPASLNNGVAASTVNCEQIGAMPSAERIATFATNTICQQQLTILSLWWADEQFGGKLLENWLTYPADGTAAARIDLVVNRQNWSLTDYLERYAFVNHFGTVARDYGYNVRVFNHQRELLATYTCNATNPRLCSIQVEATGKAQVRGSGAQI